MTWIKFDRIDDYIKNDPDFMVKRKLQLNVLEDSYVCRECLLGTHMYCTKTECECCHSRIGVKPIWEE